VENKSKQMKTKETKLGTFLRHHRFTELLQVIKSTPKSTHFMLNSYVDVFDNYNTWRKGYILEVIKNEEIKIRFDGWSSKLMR
jgi:hypothetical protein